MKAIPTPATHRWAYMRPLLIPLLATTFAISGCVPAPAPSSRPTEVRPAAPARPAPLPAPSPLASPSVGWRDAPVTPGNWTWEKTPGGSRAAFGSQLLMTCDMATRTVSLTVPAPAASESPAITVTTDTLTRALATRPVAGGFSAILPATDPLLDAMAFSRGRFALAVSGGPTLYVPSWAEVSRVIEDCR